MFMGWRVTSPGAGSVVYTSQRQVDGTFGPVTTPLRLAHQPFQPATRFRWRCSSTTGTKSSASAASRTAPTPTTQKDFYLFDADTNTRTDLKTLLPEWQLLDELSLTSKGGSSCTPIGGTNRRGSVSFLAPHPRTCFPIRPRSRTGDVGYAHARHELPGLPSLFAVARRRDRAEPDVGLAGISQAGLTRLSGSRGPRNLCKSHLEPMGGSWWLFSVSRGRRTSAEWIAPAAIPAAGHHKLIAQDLSLDASCLGEHLV